MLFLTKNNNNSNFRIEMLFITIPHMIGHLIPQNHHKFQLFVKMKYLLHRLLKQIFKLFDL
ncbi:unnamed protein product [Schistosoma curassoni]|uniref:Uncharacterized protein n=1 Tax=Schistosoma curassoni TaxID=6186 RepID=A0A183K1X0_9TREM|nr:unnamed protein product [Schistosoma curassoni]